MNLLCDSLLRVETDGGLEQMSLPELMAALGRDEVLHFPGMQRHQEDAFHVFLCYLAGNILARHEDINSRQSEQYWRAGLRSLTEGDNDDAWTLLVDDLSHPAFMQPPIPAVDRERMKTTAETPDHLDLLVTSKNHDLKQARATRAHVDEWIYALISLQTMGGFSGRGRPGISRMNSGFGNRPIVELVGSLRWGVCWRDAVQRLLNYRADVLSRGYGYSETGLVPVWIEPWDGDTGLTLNQLDPFYIEICRRIRLRNMQGDIFADAIPSDASRIAAKEFKGAVGDPWLPVDLGDSSRGQDAGEEKALTFSARGITTETLRRLVFRDGVRLTKLQEPLDHWQEEAWFKVSVLVRGQGNTQGFHERRVMVPRHVQRRIFGGPGQREPMAQLSRSALEYAGKMQHRVLKRAIAVLVQGSFDRSQIASQSAEAWWERCSKQFQALWSEHYFPWLWSISEDVDEQEVLNASWAPLLRDHALTVLREVENSVPTPTGRRYRGRVEAQRTFWAALYHKDNFPFLKEARGYE